MGNNTGEKISTTRYGGKAQARGKFAHSTHLPDLTSLTNKAYMPLDMEPNINLPIAPLPTDTQLPSQRPWEQRPYRAKQPRYSEGRNMGLRPPWGWSLETLARTQMKIPDLQNDPYPPLSSVCKTSPQNT